MLNLDDAIRMLRDDPAQAGLIRDAYLDRDVRHAATRFFTSAEFDAVTHILGWRLGGVILDLGAGNGVASYALAVSGAALVPAVDPSLSEEVGLGALRRAGMAPQVIPIAAFGEALPLRDESIDVVYMRQVLHHTTSPMAVLKECRRVLRPNGVVLVTREHVADDENQRQRFLAEHPVHQLAGGENAFPLTTYLEAFTRAGFSNIRVWGPWQSIINAFPTVRTAVELENYPRHLLERKFGRFGRFMSRVPGARGLVWTWVNRPQPGRMYSFLAWTEMS